MSRPNVDAGSSWLAAQGARKLRPAREQFARVQEQASHTGSAKGRVLLSRLAVGSYLQKRRSDHENAERVQSIGAGFSNIKE
ncbi:MAG: hypothetical protein V3U65_16355 [Granulosicoccaceae bacterium]